MNAPLKSPKVITFGCRLNAYESEVMTSHAQSAGLDNAIIINTCAVTSESTRQARQTIRRTRRENPAAKIIVTGCAAQVDPDSFAGMDEVDHVLGNDEKMSAQSYLDFGVGSAERVRVADIMEVRETSPHMIDAFGDRARAFVQVQNGCDHRCTFCIIPYGRGNSRSVPAGAVVDQIQRLVDQGYQEVVLSGVDITSYGPDLPGAPSLGKLVEKILRHVPNLPRLRLSSIDSIETDETLFRLITEHPRVMPHLHLSLQSGDNLILKRMKRRHDRDHAIAFCDRVKQARPEMVFGADLIAGFPTETEDMFANSLRLVEECALTFLHVFPYSIRPGTPAAKMPQVHGTVIKERAARLRQAGQAALARHLDGQVGKTVRVLVEKPGFARLDDFTPIALEAASDQSGQTGTAHITRHDGQTLHGTLAL